MSPVEAAPRRWPATYQEVRRRRASERHRRPRSLFAAEAIPRWTKIGEIRGESISVTDARIRATRHERVMIVEISPDKAIDFHKSTDPMRFTNHSCNANARTGRAERPGRVLPLPRHLAGRGDHRELRRDPPRGPAGLPGAARPRLRREALTTRPVTRTPIRVTTPSPRGLHGPCFQRGERSMRLSFNGTGPRLRRRLHRPGLGPRPQPLREPLVIGHRGGERLPARAHARGPTRWPSSWAPTSSSPTSWPRRTAT